MKEGLTFDALLVHGKLENDEPDDKVEKGADEDDDDEHPAVIKPAAGSAGSATGTERVADEGLEILQR